MTFEAGAFFEAVLEELREQGLILAEGDDAVADVARRKHVEFFAQAAAGAAVVADRDHGAEVTNDGHAGESYGHLGRSESEALEPLKQSGEARAAPDGDNPDAALARGLLQRQ